jgi:hypothetical protein
MTKGKHSSRKTNRIVRMPATKFPKLQKRLIKARIPITKTRKGMGT